MRVLIAVLALASLAACSPPAATSAPPAPATENASATLPPAPGQGVDFQSPSGNIGCTYTPAGGTAVYQTADGRAEVQCDRIEPTYVRVTLPETGAAHITPTDERGCCSGETIAYGETWSDGPFACEIHETDVSCRSEAGHGFTLSRARADVR
jgi:hypothetical protein